MEDAHMSGDDSDERSSNSGSRLILSLAVIIGISLFAIGFVVTVTSLSGDSVAGAQSTDVLGGADDGSAFDHNGALMLGFVLSMSGVVIATTVPAAHFLRGSKNKV